MNEYKLTDSRAAHYAKLLHWDAEEAVALLLGKNPNVALQRVMRERLSDFQRTIEYRDLKQIFTRSAHLIGHGQEFAPVNVLEWGIHNDVEIPKDLIKHVEKFHGPLQPWNPLQGYLAPRPTPMPTKSAFRQKPHFPQPDKPETGEDDLNVKAKTSLLKLVAGMAVCGYGFNPKAERNGSITDIEGDLQKLGMPLNNQTIRTWLHEAAALMDWATVDDEIVQKLKKK